MSHPLVSAQHHWWPRSLSSFWKDAEGKVNRSSSDGRLVRSTPKNFGAIRNAHQIRLGEHWSFDFEPEFSEVDNQFPGLVEWVTALGIKHQLHDFASTSRRIATHDMSEFERERLSACVASLIARSPSTRHRIRLNAEYLRQRVGLSQFQAGKNLIAGNQRGLFREICQSVKASGKFALLLTKAEEFIFGDGFLHDFSNVNFKLSRCLVPLLPTVTIMYFKPMSYSPEAQLFTIDMNDRDVKFLNSTCQIYSCNEIFSRSLPPELIKKFGDGQHYQYPYHKHPWLDELIDHLAYYRP